MRSLLIAGTALALLSTSVYAQSSSDTRSQAAPVNRKASLTQMLTKSGFTDLQIAPTSFMIRAKDSDGNPVVMAISPDSFAEVSAIDASSSTTGRANDARGTYVSVPSDSELSSNLVGLDIYNNDNKDIGTIKDIALKQNGPATAYIVSVGGFLGLGDHYVAISPSAVNVTYNADKKEWHASMNVTADQLKAAPEFKYSGK